MTLQDSPLRLWSFSHHACDVELLRRNSDLVDELKLHQYPADSAIYGALVFILVWQALLFCIAFGLYRRGGGEHVFRPVTAIALGVA